MTARFGIYVHWPYCARVCPYCAFNVRRQRDNDPAPLVGAIIADIRAHASRTGARGAATLFFGGGTPSLLPAQALAEIIAAADDAFGLAGDAEITLEANPEDRSGFASFVAAGINRLSIGVQALRDDDLRALGRNHDAAAARAAVESAARTGARFSADLIYARSGQTIGAWRAELGEALRLPAEHFSLYQLTIEPRTALARAVQHGRIAACPIEGAARFYEVTQEICDAAGAPAYEISNHARTDAARARHNLLYWEAQDWIGVGPGAHGRVTIGAVRRATKAFDAPADYIAAIARSGVGWESAEALSAIERAEEAVLMGLRLKEGLDRRSGEVGALLRTDRLAALAADGLVLASPERVALTPAGRLVADRIALELCA